MSLVGQERRIGAVRNISALRPRADVGADIVEPSMVKLGTFSAQMIAPMMYMIQIDCDNDVIITEGDAAR
jgi:hypothetical protein